MYDTGLRSAAQRRLGYRRLSARRYLRADMTVDRFFDELNRRSKPVGKETAWQT